MITEMITHSRIPGIPGIHPKVKSVSGSIGRRVPQWVIDIQYQKREESHRVG